jgi:sugar phosphate isomerase/epimerase
MLERTGVALYTVRNSMPTKPAETLKAIAALGYKYVEGAPAALAPLVSDAGLKQVSDYIPPYLITGNRKAWEGSGPLLPESYDWSAAIDESKKRGLEYMVIVYLQKAERGGLDFYKDLAARLGKAGEACQKAGLGLAYHPHSFEYEPISGVRPIDLMLKETDPKHLMLELDVFWASIGGQDPVKMLEAHAGRVPLLHLKDKAKGAAVQFDEGKVAKETFKEVGRGEIDFAGVLKAAAKGGSKYYYVEQDHCVGDPLDSLKISFDTLKKLA